MSAHPSKDLRDEKMIRKTDRARAPPAAEPRALTGEGYDVTRALTLMVTIFHEGECFPDIRLLVRTACPVFETDAS